MNIAFGPIFQVAWVVHDLDSAEKELGDRYGVERWVRVPGIHFGPEHCLFHGKPADFTIDSSLGYAGGQQVELITPVSGDSHYTDMLTRSGPGLHHIAWVPEDFDAALTAIEANGTDIVARGVFPEIGMESIYLDGGPLGAYIELLRLSPQVRAMFDSMVPEGYRNPWQ
ncbi:VOC family protein [Nocardia sp. NEAU-G5]|uniref:VOC family protein n=1 Tax=Nocardia albiluteola TaxID=2842303 RepID=A0ABS6AQH7_9NOCA|nr:VOC family protein [Nocardia albiluteola]MBU3060276.1 VOC family protein [Nocardia albiluteola]